jgi:protein TonB
MSVDLIARNLALYSAQIAILIAVCAAVVFVLRLRAPAARLLFWQVALAACLALPLAPARRVPVNAFDASVAANSVVLGAAPVSSDASPRFPWTGILVAAAAAGAAVRLAWLTFGFLRLDGFRRAAAPLTPPNAVSESCASLGAFPEILLSDEVVSPVTFWIRRPTVLLPRGFLNLAPGAQRAIICHELIHVRRRDWAFTAVEEIVRALLWFHPAVWWLLAQLQLAREQAVDNAVIEHTRARDEYLNALLAIASGSYQADLATAALFLKRRHLRERVAAMLKGAVMSRARLVVSMTAAFSVLPAAAAIIAWQLPLAALPQISGAPDAPGVQVMTGPYKLLHRTPIDYPPEQAMKGIGGEVVVTVTLDPGGEVIDARVVSGPEALRRPVLQSVLRWHFANDPPPPSNFEITVRFNPEAMAGGAAPPEPRPIMPPPAGPKTLTISKIDLTQLPDALRSKVETALPVREGDILDASRWGELLASLHSIDEHLAVDGSISEGKYASLRIVIRGPGGQLPPAPADPEKRVRLGADVLNEKVVNKVAPEYPPLAKQAKVQGAVKFRAVIGKDGHVKDLTLISGHPLLVPAAAEAVKQWVYRPTLLNGDPVEVITEITLHFTLSDAPADPRR